MGIFFNEFTGTDSVGITAGNSGAGGSTAFTAVESNVYFSTTRATIGSSSMRVDGVPAVSAGARVALGGVRNLAARFYMYLTAADADLDVFRISHATDTTAMTLRMMATGAVRVVSKGSVTSWTSAESYPLNSWVRVEVYVQQGTGTTGTVQIAFYAGNSTTAIDSATLTGVALGGDLGGLTQMRIGKSSTGSHSAHWIDSFAWNTDADAVGFIGAPVNAAPTVEAGANQNVTTGATVSLSATASDTDGSISGYAWSFLYPASGAPTLTGANTQTASFTAGAAGPLYVLRCQATDNGGATGSDTVEIRVPKATDFATLPMDGVAVGAWTRAGGASTDGAALADNDDATYTESPDFTGSTQTEEYRLEPIVARDNLSFTVRTVQTSTGGTVQVALVEGTTVRQTWTVPSSLTAANTTLTVTTPSAIVDWGNLRLRFSVVS